MIADDLLSVASETHLRSLHARLMSNQNTEKVTTSMLELLLLTNRLAFLWRLPEIKSWRFEAPAAGLRIDLQLEHVDGSTTLVEAKGDVESTELAKGIGQLYLYAAILEKPCRLVLCSTSEIAKAFHAIRACEHAGVQYGFLPSFDQFQVLTTRLRVG